MSKKKGKRRDKTEIKVSNRDNSGKIACKFLGGILIGIGIFFLISINGVMTGAVIGVSLSSGWSFFIGLIFVIVGVLIQVNIGLEGIVNVHESSRKEKKFIEATGMNEIASFIQIDYNAPFDNYLINLEQLNDLLGPETIDVEERERIVDNYSPSIKGIIRHNLVDYFIFRPIELDKKERAKKEKELKLAYGAEELLQVLNPEYKTRKDRLRNLKNTDVGKQPFVYNPINEGKAAYVHFTSPNSAREIIREGGVFEGENQSMYFSDLDKAREFVGGINQRQARSLTGATSAESAIIFQSVYPPDKMNKLVGSGKTKAFYQDLEIGDCYTVRVENVPVAR